MIIHSDYRGNYKQDPCKNFGFERFENRKKGFILCIGLGSNFRKGQLKFVRQNKNKKIVLLQLEEPNRFLKGKFHFEYETNLFKILTICPYTAEWANKKFRNKKRVSVFIPFNKDYIPPKTKKKYDVIYTGHLSNKRILRIVQIISKFNYRIVSDSSFGIIRKFLDKCDVILSKLINNFSYKFKIQFSLFDKFERGILRILNTIARFFVFNHYGKLITNKGCSYTNKLKLISESKITIIHNLIDPEKEQIANLKNIRGIKKNKAFERVFSKNSKMIIPQIKSRLFEAAFCRSLILCRKDCWNLIENFFEKGKEFIYYENEDELEAKIKDILNDYEKYKPIIEKAFTKALNNYTTKNFYEKYLAKL